MRSGRLTGTAKHEGRQTMARKIKWEIGMFIVVRTVDGKCTSVPCKTRAQAESIKAYQEAMTEYDYEIVEITA